LPDPVEKSSAASIIATTPLCKASLNQIARDIMKGLSAESR